MKALNLEVKEYGDIELKAIPQVRQSILKLLNQNRKRTLFVEAPYQEGKTCFMPVSTMSALFGISKSCST